MPERFNICCLFDQAPLNRRSVFDKLFGSDPSWMGRPFNLMVLDINSGIMIEENWPPCDSLMEQELETKVLFAYSNWTTGLHRFRSAISLAEKDGRAVYTFSFPVSLLRQSSIEQIEQRLLRIYDAARLMGTRAILAGSELEIQSTLSPIEAILSSWNPASLVVWIVAGKDDLPKEISPFIMMVKKGGVLLRHTNASIQVFGSTEMEENYKEEEIAKAQKRNPDK